MYGTTESLHKDVAEELEKVILSVMKKSKSPNKNFVKKQIYPLYIEHCHGAFIQANPEIIAKFETKKKTTDK